MKRWGWIALVVYIGLMGSGLAALSIARRHALSSLDTAPQRQAWEQWREEAGRQQGPNVTVQRRAPSSAEPPALVLLRDHYATCLVGALLLTTLLYGSTVLFIRGALFGPKFEINVEDRRVV